MAQLTRRNFLKGSSSSIFLTRVAPLATTASLLAVDESKAWVTVALAVASTVAGMVAAHNQSDGGLGAMVSANYELTRVAITKLTAIENRLTDIFTMLSGLTDEIDLLLKQETTRKLHIEMLSVVKGYHEALSSRPPELDFDTWKSERLTQHTLMVLLDRLQKARQEISVQDLVDPSTALIASTTGFVETNLKNMLGFRTYDIVGVITNVYLPWLDAILDDRRFDSAAGYTVAARQRLDKLFEQGRNNSIGKGLNMAPGAMLQACTGVDDFAPEAEFSEQVCEFDSTITRSISSQEDAPAVSTRAQDPEETHAARRSCQVATKPIPARIGDKDRLAVSLTLTEEEITVGQNNTGVLGLILTQGAEVRGLKGADILPADTFCSIETANILDRETRLKRMREMPARASSDSAYNELRNIVDLINLERQRVAYGAKTMIACQISRDNLSKLRQLYA